MKKALAKTTKSTRSTSQLQDVDTVVAGTTAIAVVLTAWFIFSVFTVGQNLIQNGILGTPNVYAAWIALVFGGYSWVNSRNLGVRQVVSGMFVAITTGLLIWIFGMTGLGATLGY